VVHVTKSGNISNSVIVKRFMRALCIVAFVVTQASAVAALAQSAGTCAATYSAPAKAGMTLTIESRPAEAVLTGSDREGIRVSCTVSESSRAAEVKIHFEQTGDFGKLRVDGGPSNNMHIRIELPRKTNLKLRVPAGEVRVDQLAGDKDILLKAGEIVVSGVTASEYRSVDASVGVGAVSAEAWGVRKGGFLRNFTKESAGGTYRLHAHLISGNIQLD